MALCMDRPRGIRTAAVRRLSSTRIRSHPALIFRLQNTLLWGEVSVSEILDPIRRIVRATRLLFMLLALLERSAATATIADRITVDQNGKETAT